MRDESMPIYQMRLMAGLSVGKVVGRWDCAGVPAARPRAVATAARATVRRRGEDMGGGEWVMVGAGIPYNAADDGGGIPCRSAHCPEAPCRRKPDVLPATYCIPIDCHSY